MNSLQVTVPRLLRLPQVTDATGLTRSSVYKRVREGFLTPPIKLSRSSAWPESEVAALNAAVIAGKSGDDLRDMVKQLVAARSQASAA